jgi:hypothetical protein
MPSYLRPKYGEIRVIAIMLWPRCPQQLKSEETIFEDLIFKTESSAQGNDTWV